MTHPTLTATQVVVTTVPDNMSGDETDTPLPSSFRTPRHPSISPSATRDGTIPPNIITDTTAPASQPVLTKPEIAGVTVGSIAAAGLVFGLLALCFCLRRRREKRRRASIESFGNDKIVIDQPRNPAPTGALPTQDLEHGIRAQAATETQQQSTPIASARPQSDRWSFWRKSMRPEDIGVAVAPGHAQQTSYDRSPVTPVSAASYETTSRLLPDKPTYSLYPPPLRLSSYNHVSPIDPPGSQVVDFARLPPGPIMRPAPAPRGQGTMDTSQMYLQHGQPTLRHVPSDPFVDSTSSGHAVSPRQYQTLPTQRPKAAAPAPAPIPVQYGQWAEPVEVHRKPVPARLAPNDPRAAGQIGRPHGLSTSPSHPASSAASSSRATPPVRRKSSGKRTASGRRPTTSLSTTSDTSFEDAESDDEPPPPLPKPVPSPFVESPRSRPHAAAVRYPVVPTLAATRPNINQPIREAGRMQIELNPESDRSKEKAKLSPRTPSPRNKPVPEVPELAGSPLSERQQVPDSSSDRIKPGSAKWSILVAPGLEGIENAATPRSQRSAEWTPLSTPTRRTR
ncbi:MAG: hypothetical protein Q9200_003470 [Gallowayella weberi]